jgi:biopolymer transport protein ExbD
MLASNLERFNRIEVASSDAGAQAGEQRSSLFLRVHGDGSFSLVDVRMNALTLERRIKAHLDRNAANAVVVHPDGDVRLQHLIDVLDRLAELGVAELTLG